jgi:hypothetical protein
MQQCSTYQIAFAIATRAKGACGLLNDTFDDAVNLMFGVDSELGVEIPDYGPLQLAGDFDQVQGLGFFKRKKKKGRRVGPRVRAPGGAMRRRAGAAAAAPAPRIIVQRVPVQTRVAAPQPVPQPQQSPANTAEVSYADPEPEVFDEAPVELIEEASEEVPSEDEAMEGGLGIFKWAKRTINRNKNTLRAGAALIPGAGGVIANAVLNRGGSAPSTPGISAPVKKPAVKKPAVKKVAVKPAGSALSNQTLIIGGGLFLAVALISRK